MDDYLKTDMTEFGLMLKSINPSVEWIAIPPEVKWVDAGCSMNQLSALKCRTFMFYFPSCIRLRRL